MGGFLVGAGSLQAQSASSSSAFGESVSVNLVPLLGGGTNVGSGPLPMASGAAGAAYSQTRTAASASVSLPVGGRLLQTGLLTSMASSTVPNGVETLGQADVDAVVLSIVETLPLVTFTAGEVQSRAAIGGTCGQLSTEDGTTLVGAHLGGTLVGSVAVDGHPAPNTTLFDAAGIRIVLNEQFVSGNGQTSHSITVNAVHVTLSNVLLTGLGVLQGEIVIGQSKASLSCVPSVGTADLSLSLADAPDPVSVGGQLAYHLVVTNQGPQAATGVVVTNLLPASVDFHSATPGQGHCAGTSEIVCQLGTVPAGGTVQIEIAGSPSAAGTIVDTAQVHGDQNDPDPSDDSASASTLVTEAGPPTSLADLEISGAAPTTPVHLGNDYPCDLVVHNAGPQAATETTMVLTVPATASVLSASISQGSCQIGNGGVTCVLGSVAVNGSRTIHLQLHPSRTGAQTLHAVVTSTVSDPNPADNETLITTSVVADAPPVDTSAAQCRVGVVPAATLLIPYFEVDLADPTGATTLIGITNVRPGPRLARVTLWTDWGVPTLSFDLYLTGYDLQTLNVRDLLLGHLPTTGAAASPHGEQSAANTDFPGCGTLGVGPDGASVAEFQAWHQGLASPRSGRCGGRPKPAGALAVGYVTIDVVQRCSNLTPAGSGYFGEGGTGVASDDNALLGDFFLVDAKGNFAEGEPAVHLLADADRVGEETFYSRLVGGNGSDDRQPLGSLFGLRFLAGGAFTGGTELLVWRDPQHAATASVACGSAPGWYPLPQNGVLAFDEQENPFFLLPDDQRFPVLTGRTKVGGPSLQLPTAFGWMALDLAVPRAPAPLTHSQAWVVVLMTANGRFGVGLRAAQLDDACGF